MVRGLKVRLLYHPRQVPRHDARSVWRAWAEAEPAPPTALLVAQAGSRIFRLFFVSKSGASSNLFCLKMWRILHLYVSKSGASLCASLAVLPASSLCGKPSLPWRQCLYGASFGCILTFWMYSNPPPLATGSDGEEEFTAAHHQRGPDRRSHRASIPSR